MDNPLFLDYNVNMQRDEMADNLELECLFNHTHSCSIVSVAQEMGIIDENEDDIDEINNIALSEALGIIDSRNNWCAGKYPFLADTNTIQYQTTNEDISSVYTFLLLATREKMNTQSIADGINGTLLFERLSACILKNYFGEASHVSVFGTGSGISESFKDKLKRLLSEIGERGYSLREDAIEPTQKDGGIDLYAFIPFKDGKKGQFIGFGQCKTGTSWSSVLGMMCPETFDLYLTPRFIFTPISIYMLSDTVPSQKWDRLSLQSRGFIFDRCRLMNWLPPQIDNGILEEIKRWNAAVIARYQKKIKID